MAVKEESKKQSRMICAGKCPDSSPSLLAVTSYVWTRINVLTDFGRKESFKCSMLDLRRMVEVEPEVAL